MIISEKSFETPIPSVMYAITRLTSRFFSGSCAREGGGGERERAAAAFLRARGWRHWPRRAERRLSSFTSLCARSARARHLAGASNDRRVCREPRRATHGEPGVARSAARKALVALRFPSRPGWHEIRTFFARFPRQQNNGASESTASAAAPTCLTPQPALSRRQIAALAFVSAYQAPALAPRTAASGVSMNLDGLKQKAKDVRAATHQPWRAKIQRLTRPPDPFLTARSSTRSSASGTR